MEYHRISRNQPEYQEMKKRIVLTFLAVVGLSLALIIPKQHQKASQPKKVFVDRGFNKEENEEYRTTTNKGRYEYFNRLLADPIQKRIPENIRTKELQFAQKMVVSADLKAKVAASNFEWTEIGPHDVGGRTRGFAIDARNNNILLAGGASGGIWKSTDGGQSWELKSEFGHNLGVSDIVQHPIHQDTWYYSTAEFFGSAESRDGSASFFGSGIYISTDNGETWSQVPSTSDNDNSFNSQYDFISSMAISPTTGTIFFASNALGIFRSSNNLLSSSYVLGLPNNHIYAEVETTAEGIIIATLSKAFSGIDQDQEVGVYISTDDGISWQNIAPNSYPSNAQRAVIGVSESHPNFFYVFVDTGLGANGLKLFQFNISNPDDPSFSDLSDNIPNFGGEVGDLNPQGGYNLLCKVSPSNANKVFLGATNLFRSLDGFSTSPPTDGSGFTDPDQAEVYWIGATLPTTIFLSIPTTILTNTIWYLIPPILNGHLVPMMAA